MSEVCTIQITVSGEGVDSRDEDIVKTVWPYCLPWFTRRHGVEAGKIEMTIPGRYREPTAVCITWRYETTDDKNTTATRGESGETGAAEADNADGA